MPTYLRPAVAAQYLGISTSKLAKLRLRHNRANGPAFVKLAGCVLYRREDLDEWLNQHLVQG
ncbi:helix-turn-helix domain-containing protein [Tropicimonas sediminicola]|uniref:helix-turn-helix transcriptional regulator n=1 Tax=Tropicimonas sediminicola TaxID=1031541 RepID=UPI00113191A1